MDRRPEKLIYCKKETLRKLIMIRKEKTINLILNIPADLFVHEDEDDRVEDDGKLGHQVRKDCRRQGETLGGNVN